MTHCPMDGKECRHAEDAAERSADAAVRKTFAMLGVDVNDPRQIEEFRQDLRFGGKMRKFIDTSTTRMIITFITLVFGGVLLVIWDGIKLKLGGS